MVKTFSLPKIIEMEIDALVDSGYYSSKSDVAKDAFRTLFETKKNLRVVSAVELYKRGKVSIGRAAEIASVSLEEFKNILSSFGVSIEVDAKGSDEGAKEILEDSG